MTTATERPQADDRFGLCPHCHNHDGYMHIRSNHIFVCDVHKTAWNPASNMFSDWKDETEEVWERNKALLSSYTEVKPYYPGRAA